MKQEAPHPRHNPHEAIPAANGGEQVKVKPESKGVDGGDKFAPNLMRAYVDSYRGPQGDAPVIGDRGLTAPAQVRALQVVTPALLAAHSRLGFSRKPGDTNVATYGDDDRKGFGPALQVVAEDAPMLLESVAVLLNRLGIAYIAILSPVFRVRRSPDGVLEEIRTATRRRRGRRGVDPRRARPRPGPQGPGRGRTPTTVGRHRRSARGARHRSDARCAAHTGGRPGPRRLGPLPGR